MADHGARLIEEHLPEIEAITDAVCRRRGMVGDEADDFRSWVLERLVDGDAAILRKFRGDSSMRTYLVVVINNLFRDHLVRLRGKWRPSAQARRLGATAVALEELLHRKGRTLGEAERELRSRGVCDLTTRQLAELAALLPRREPLRPTRAGPLELARVPARTAADGDVERTEVEDRRDEVLSALGDALDDLPPEDRLIVRLRFLEGRSVADVSRALGLDQKPLYRRVNGLLRQLREYLENRDVTVSTVAALLENPPPLDPAMRESAGVAGLSPSGSVQSGDAG